MALPSVPARPARPQPAFPCRWLERTLPPYCSCVAALLQQMLQLLWVKAAELTLHISKQCFSFLSWAGECLLWLLEWVRMGGDEQCPRVRACGAALLPA